MLVIEACGKCTQCLCLLWIELFWPIKGFSALNLIYTFFYINHFLLMWVANQIIYKEIQTEI